MGLDISAYSRLRFTTADVADDYEGDDVHVYAVPGGTDRMDGLPYGLYARTEDVHLWWHAEHGTHAIPGAEIAEIEERIAALRDGAKPECPGDLVVLEDTRATTEDHGFRAGSYSGYNWWREQLSKLGLDATPGDVWEDVERFADKPFVELINFSDCEGTIGPRTSAKLAHDFAVHADRIAARAETSITDEDERSYFLESYADWRRAFELAARDGFVVFH